METKEGIDLSVLTSKVVLVAEQSAAHETAIEVERAAEAAVLEAVIEKVKPSLRALSSRIVQTYGETSGRNGCNPQSLREHFAERGLCLVDEYTSQRDSSGNRGGLDGWRLYILTDGRFAKVTREGTFSHWQAEWDRYEADLRVIDAIGAVKLFRRADKGVADVIEAIVKALDEQIAGTAPARTKAATERAAQLRAVVALAK